MSNVFEGKFGEQEEEEKPTAEQCLEEFLEHITRPALEEGYEAVDAVVVQLDDRGVSVGSNMQDPAHLVMLLELAKLSLLEQFMGVETGGPDGTIH